MEPTPPLSRWVRIWLWLERRSRLEMLGLATISLLGIAVLDYETGRHYSVAIGYLLPVSLSAWWLGLGLGLLFAGLGALGWLTADVLGGGAVIGWLPPLWNATVRGLVFAVVAALLALLRTRYAHLDTLLREAIVTQQQLSSQLLQLQRLEAMGRLAASVAHEFANLLQVLQGYAELIKPTQTTARHLEALRQSVTRGSTLTQQLRTFSRQQQSTPQVIDLNTVLREQMPLLAVVLRGGIRLEVSLCETALPVSLDVALWAQVLVNLGLNARDALAGEAGQVAVATQRLRVHGRWWAVLWVSDTGGGMAPETAARCFEPFFTTKPEGSGQGLAVVYGVVTQHGGTITVTSAPGEGASFEIRLPLVEEGS